MNFASSAAPRRLRENIVPMINVVFLLLIFFLMTAQITPPDPIEVSLPLSNPAEIEVEPNTLYIAANGALAFENQHGDAALIAAVDASKVAGVLDLRVDAALPGARLAQILQQLGQSGVARVTLLTGAR